MKEVVLQIPTLESEQNIDIEVKINGKKRTLHYRVEIVALDEYSEEDADRVDVIKRVIREYDKDWRLIEIGMPTDTRIPIMFRKRREVKVGEANV
jgi:hypothetical protein